MELAVLITLSCWTVRRELIYKPGTFSCALSIENACSSSWIINFCPLTQIRTIKLYTDAFSDTCFAAIFGKKWVAWKWHGSFSSSAITLLLLHPLVVLTGICGGYLANFGILFTTYNAGVIQIIHKLRSKNQQIMKLARSPVSFSINAAQRAARW